jgi:molybdopterin-guanine dinucleotide biosynthesis protein A
MALVLDKRITMPPSGHDRNMDSQAPVGSTPATHQVTGVILAGGRSARMGQDKSGAIFHGETFLARARRLLRAMDLADIVVLGPEKAAGEPDPFPGPARALAHWLKTQGRPLDLLVIPVDMPALTKAPLEHLLAQAHGGYYHDLYLPFFAPKARFEPHLPAPARLRELLEYWRLGAQTIAPEWEIALTGVNTPHELTQLEAATESNKTG